MSHLGSPKPPSAVPEPAARSSDAVLRATRGLPVRRAASIAPASRADVARSGVGVAYRKGQPKPDVSSAESLKKALLDAPVVTWSAAGATGNIMKKALEQLGIAEQMGSKVRMAAGGKTAPDLVAQGEAVLGFTQISEILDTPGAELAGPLPAPLQTYTTFSAGIATTPAEPAAADAFARFLRSSETASVVRKKGMEPVAP